MRLFEHPDFEQVVLEAKDFSPTVSAMMRSASRSDSSACEHSSS